MHWPTCPRVRTSPWSELAAKTGRFAKDAPIAPGRAVARHIADGSRGRQASRTTVPTGSVLSRGWLGGDLVVVKASQPRAPGRCLAPGFAVDGMAVGHHRRRLPPRAPPARARACGWLGCQFRDSRSRTIRVAAAGDPLTKPKNGPKSCVAEKPVMYRPARLV